MPMNLGPVRVKFLYYDTPKELFYMLRQLEASHDADPLVSGNLIVLGVPDKLRKFMGWPAQATPKPEIHGDVIAFTKG
jgi:hypothetical protein